MTINEYIYIAAKSPGDCACVGVFPAHTTRDVRRARFTRNDERGLPFRTGQAHFEWDAVGDLGQVFGGGN